MAHPACPDSTDPSASGENSLAAESSTRLLERAKAGDRSALDRLLARYLPALRRWAAGRLPRWARDATDTHDLVQDAVAQTLPRLGSFEARRTGALHAYLRQAVTNGIRDRIRRAGRNAGDAGLEPLEARGPSPLDQAIERQEQDRYRTALSRLRPRERDAVVARIELGLKYEAIARSLGHASPDAARLAVRRALLRLAEEMRRAR